MPHYIQTKILKLESGAVEVSSELKFSESELIPAGAADMPSVIDAAKRKTRETIFRKFYQQQRNDAIRALAAIHPMLNQCTKGWQLLEFRRQLDKAFAPLLSAGKWLEEDAAK